MKNLLLIALTFVTSLAMASGMGVKPLVLNPGCNGSNTGGIELYVSGGILPLTYEWSNNLPAQASQSHLYAGTYYVTVTDNANNTVSASVYMAQPAGMNINMSVTNATGTNVNNGSIALDVQGGNPGYTYEWNTTSTNENLWNIPAGNYYVTVTDAAGCTAQASNTVHEVVYLTSDNTASLAAPNAGGNAEAKSAPGTDNSVASQTVVYPNPASDHIIVKSNNEGNTEVRLLNTSGQLVYEQKYSSNEANVEVANLATGNYVMVIQNAQGEVSRMVSISR